jgi:hypothetical protein
MKERGDGDNKNRALFSNFTKHLQNPIDFNLFIYNNKYSKNQQQFG